MPPAAKDNPKIGLRKADDLVPDPRNARVHSGDQIDLICSLIRRFGWTQPILADDTIVAGHGRQLAAQKIYSTGELIYLAPGKDSGGKALPAGYVPVIDCAGWSDEDKRAYMLADNQSALNASWDDQLLAQEMAALSAIGFDVQMIGFDADSVAQMLEGLNETGSDEGAGAGPNAPEQFPEFDEEIPVEHRCPKCNYAWSGKAS